ncbi:MAG: glutathione S-transferase [Rhizobiales bacterium 65-9]|nr:glutathione S-transferase family protein [Hyphomicrobiales bacterium]OJY37280.1 MAG: glutathione S-transferase [Rhizobiales bacterium 65-9]
MSRLHHHPFCPQSRFIRLACAEAGLAIELVEERVWERRTEFLALNPAATVPVLVEEAFAIPGAGVIAEYLDETRGLALGDRRLLPDSVAGRIEVRRLLDWFNLTFAQEVSEPLVREKIYKRQMGAAHGGGAPDAGAIRAARNNVRYHLRYVGHLIGRRKWLAGDRMSYADLVAAAHLSCVDYLGDAPWSEDEAAKEWYARIKSRPSFRPLLAEKILGTPAAPHYADLDF